MCFHFVFLLFSFFLQYQILLAIKATRLVEFTFYIFFLSFRYKSNGNIAPFYPGYSRVGMVIPREAGRSLITEGPQISVTLFSKPPFSYKITHPTPQKKTYRKYLTDFLNILSISVQTDRKKKRRKKNLSIRYNNYLFVPFPYIHILYLFWI